MAGARRIAKGSQVDRRQIARNPREGLVNTNVPDLVAIYAERRERGEPVKPTRNRKSTALPADEPAGETQVAEERPAQLKNEPSPAPDKPEKPSGPVRIRYNGAAGRFRIAGYAFRPGQVLEVDSAAALEILTYPYERFTRIEE